MMIKFVLKFWKFLSEDANPHEVGLAFAFAFLMGLQPLSLMSITIFLIFFIMKVNKAAGFLGILIFKPLSLLAEPLIVVVGSIVLERIPVLLPLWTMLRNIPIVPLTKFYNTAAMGGVLVGIVGFVPIYLLFKKLYIAYSKSLKPKIAFLNKKKKDEQNKSEAAQAYEGGVNAN